MNLFVDLDGVLADIIGGYKKIFGDIAPNENIDWHMVNDHRPNFFYFLNKMPDADHLWKHIAPFNPTIVSVIPFPMPAAEADKYSWASYFFPETRILFVLRRGQKYIYSTVGDVLIDDNRDEGEKWKQHGGIFIHHKNAVRTIETLQEIIENGESKRAHLAS